MKKTFLPKIIVTKTGYSNYNPERNIISINERHCHSSTLFHEQVHWFLSIPYRYLLHCRLLDKIINSLWDCLWCILKGQPRLIPYALTYMFDYDASLKLFCIRVIDDACKDLKFNKNSYTYTACTDISKKKNEITFTIFKKVFKSKKQHDKNIKKLRNRILFKRVNKLPKNFVGVVIQRVLTGKSYNNYTIKQLEDKIARLLK